MLKETKKCPQCDSPFEAYICQNKKFCTTECYIRNRNITGSLKRPRKGDDVPCDICGEMFYRKPGQIKADRRFCSKSCSDASQRKDALKKKCEVCGIEMILKPSQTNRFCSRECMGLHNTKRPLNRHHNGKSVRQDKNGYVMVWEPFHPNQSQKGWQYEHRMVAERALGRHLSPNEDVHHKNRVKDDNRPENLEVMDHIEHINHHGAEFRDELKALRAELASYRLKFGPLS